MLVQGSCAIVTTTKREIMQTLSQTIQTTGNLTLILIWKKKCLISFFPPRVLFEFSMINNINIWELVKKKKKIPWINLSLLFKFSLLWGSYFKIALTKETCNVSFGQIAPALQLRVELILIQPWKKTLLTFAFDGKWDIYIYIHTHK